MSDLYLKQMLVGPMANFTYLLGSKRTHECYVVDPAWDVAAIQAAAAADGMKITGALVTHYHPDHCGGHLWGHDIQGIAELLESTGMPVYAHADELDGISLVTGIARSELKACHGGDKLTIGDVTVTLVHTPGHTPGSQCFLAGDALVAGDTLFISGCGRVDLPGGNADQLYDSLTTKLAKLPPQTVLYPGHNYDSAPHATLAAVRRSNQYLQVASLADWRRLHGG